MPWLAFMLSALVAAGCSSGPRSNSDSDRGGGTLSGNQESSEQYGPPSPDGEETPSQYGPEPIQLRPITLVFGPGMARAHAQVGALRALVAHKIPIQAIYGIEVGGLVAALYAMDANINHFEWSLLRIKDETFLTDRGLLGKFFGSAREGLRGDPAKLEQQLRQAFGARDISDAKIPLRIAFQRKGASEPILLDKGDLVPALRVAMSGPGFFGAGTWEGTPAQAASDVSSVAFVCGEAKAHGGDSPVVFVDTAVTSSDPSSSDLVIRPNLSGLGPADFSKKTDAAFRGKRAVEERLPDLRRLVGLPSGSGDEAAAEQRVSPVYMKEGISQ